MLRRRGEVVRDVLKCGDISLDLGSYELFSDKDRFLLSRIEYQLMELFMLNQGAYISTEDLLTKVWGYDTESDIGIVWVYISYLRKKLAMLSTSVGITAKRGVGYMLEEQK